MENALAYLDSLSEVKKVFLTLALKGQRLLKWSTFQVLTSWVGTWHYTQTLHPILKA
jgi:hypothetical protein